MESIVSAKFLNTKEVRAAPFAFTESSFDLTNHSGAFIVSVRTDYLQDQPDPPLAGSFTGFEIVSSLRSHVDRRRLYAKPAKRASPQEK